MKPDSWSFRALMVVVMVKMFGRFHWHVDDV
jgi:hypothetical protein